MIFFRQYQEWPKKIFWKIMRQNRDSRFLCNTEPAPPKQVTFYLFFLFARCVKALLRESVCLYACVFWGKIRYKGERWIFRSVYVHTACFGGRRRRSCVSPRRIPWYFFSFGSCVLMDSLVLLRRNKIWLLNKNKKGEKIRMGAAGQKTTYLKYFCQWSKNYF